MPSPINVKSPRYMSAENPLGFARRPDPICTCADRVGLVAWIKNGCEVHGTQEAARRAVDAVLLNPPPPEAP